jgi:hypothetical protein
MFHFLYQTPQLVQKSLRFISPAYLTSPLSGKLEPDCQAKAGLISNAWQGRLGALRVAKIDQLPSTMSGQG